MPLIQGRVVILCLSITIIALGSLLAQLDEWNKERVIYYIIQSIVGYKMNYINIKKSCISIVFIGQKLRNYMLNRKIELMSKVDPLKYLLEK